MDTIPQVPSPIGVQSVIFNTIANRPVNAVVGHLFYATDTAKLYYWTGSTWTEITTSGSTTYTTTTPTTATVGGIASGTSYVAATMQTVLDDLLHPYQTPTFSAFAMTGVTDVEVGTDVSGEKTFTWTTTNPTNVTANSISITDVTGGSVVIESALPDTSSKVHDFSVAFTRDDAGVYRFTITGTNSLGATFTRNLDINFYWKVYYGESASTSLDEAAIEALRVGGLQAAFAATYAFAAANYKYLCYPVVLGAVSSFKDSSTGLDVPFEAPATVSVTNAQGVATDYYVYRSTNILGAAIDIIVA
jgi:hypothetical protein